MPYKSEKLIIQHTEFDRRIKLTSLQKEEIISLHSKGISQRELARRFKVDRRLISFIIDPASYAKNLKRREERGGTKVYYNKEKHKDYIREHRRYKQKLKLENKI